MTRLPQISYRKFIKVLKKSGFVFKRQARGSHEIWFNTEKKLMVTVPRHRGRTLKKGTLMAMMKSAGLSREDLR